MGSRFVSFLSAAVAVTAVAFASGCASRSYPRQMNGTWCSLGTSITWYNNNVTNANGRFTTGYQTLVMRKLVFAGFENRGVNGGTIGDQIGRIGKADYYTIEHGVNDWGHSTPVGTVDDYRNDTRNGTFCANYRRVIDEIRALNPAAKIILCTPRKGYGFGSYLPASWKLAKNGIYLEDYAKAVRAIAVYEGVPVADFFANCGDTDEMLRKTSIDVALHPNDLGYALMAEELTKAFGGL